MRSPPECHLCARARHLPSRVRDRALRGCEHLRSLQPGPIGGRSGSFRYYLKPGGPEEIAGKRTGKRGECRAARLHPPEQLSLAGHRGSAEVESKCAPRCLSTARTHAEPVVESRSKMAGRSSPRGLPLGFAGVRTMRPEIGGPRHPRMDIAQHVATGCVEDSGKLGAGRACLERSRFQGLEFEDSAEP